jgi:hypothetical protein
MDQETKEDRFRRVAERRVENVLKALRSLSQCANPRIYAWQDDQLEKIWRAIEGELSSCRQAFTEPDARTFKL